MTELRLATATLLPGALAVLVYLAEKNTAFARLGARYRQIVIGVLFGGVAVLATEYGIPVDGAILNIRTAAPLTAGLLFGGPAGILAGVIGGVERWFSVYWGGGAYTRLACTLATLMAGFVAAFLRKYMFDDKKPSCLAGFTIGMANEVLHMLLVFLTNMADLRTAMAVVQKCAVPMIFLNALAVALALGAVRLIGKTKRAEAPARKRIADVFRSGLFWCVVAAFTVTCVFTALMQVQITRENVTSSLEKGLAEVPPRLEKNIESTFLLYSDWIVADLQKGDESIDQIWTKLAVDYEVQELFLADADGVIKASNLKATVGSTLPEDLRLPAGQKEAVGRYATSLLDGTTPMQYTATALGNSAFLLVGYDESYIIEETEKRIKTIAPSNHVGQDGYLMICDAAGIVISDGSEVDHVGQPLSALGIDLAALPQNTMVSATLAGDPVRLMVQSLDTPAGSYTVLAAIPESEAVFARDATIYNTAFMEILVFAVLFVHVYFMTKRVVVDNIHKVNDSLAKITGGNLNERVNVRENEEFASLSEDINQTVDTLKHYIAEAAARIDEELEFAKAIQHAALPSVFPPYPNRRDFDIYALMETAKEVGGDFYDFYLLEGDRLGFLIADVSGKGVPAALFMMRAKSVIKVSAESGAAVDEIFNAANATLCEGNETGMFVTAWIGILDLRSGLLSFANAGHNPPLLRHRDGAFEYLRTRPNFILAGMEGTRYKKQELQLGPGDEIFLYTDGVTEAQNTKQQLFGEERLLAALNRTPNEGVELRCKHLLQVVGEFVGEADQFDDITMLSLRLNAPENENRILLQPDMASTDTVWQFLDSKIKKAALPRKLGTKLKVCTDEIYSNILRYSGATEAEILWEKDDATVTLTFRDNGTPFDPTALPAPDVNLPLEERQIGGLGIYMVKKSVQSIAYAYREGRNVLTLTFAL